MYPKDFMIISLSLDSPDKVLLWQEFLWENLPVFLVTQVQTLLWNKWMPGMCQAIIVKLVACSHNTEIYFKISTHS